MNNPEDEIDSFGRARRELLKAIAIAPFTKNPVSVIFREQREEDITFNCSIFTYHEVHADRMATDIIGLINRGIEPISLDTYVGALNGEVEIPRGMQTFMITCDDGLKSQYTQGLSAVDIVEQQTNRFVPLTLFSMTRFEGLPIPVSEMDDNVPSFNDNKHQYMTKGQLFEMLKRGHYVQNHTIDHRNLPGLRADQRRDQVELAEGRIDELWQAAGRQRLYRAFAYPYGGYRGQEEYILSVGFNVAFTTVSSTQHRLSQRFRAGRVRRS